MRALTSKQCRMGRAALDWSQQHLASRSGVGSTSIKKFETGTALRPLLLAALRRAMEEAGIGFIDEGSTVSGQPAAFGVFLRADAAGSSATAAEAAVASGPHGPD